MEEWNNGIMEWWTNNWFSQYSNLDELVKSRNSIEFVIPAEAGIQSFQDVLDPGFRRGDAPRDFLRDHQPSIIPILECFFSVTSVISEAKKK